MKDTYNIQAIILRRLKFRENDSKITAYSLERGRQDLVVRGTSRPKSKLVAHIEPLNLVNIMIIPGKRVEYAGSVISEKCFLRIKNSYEKIQAASSAIKIFLENIKEEEADENLFFLLSDFLSLLDSEVLEDKDLDFFVQIFVFKLLDYLGHKPELNKCVLCKEKIKEKDNIFDCLHGGMVCEDCLANPGSLTISSDCVKLLRLLPSNNFIYLAKIKCNCTLNKEIIRIIKIYNNFVNG